MAATDMSKAGLEIGCKVLTPYSGPATVVRLPTDIDPDVAVRTDPPATTRSGNVCFKPDQLVRDYADTQRARHKRLSALLERFHGGATEGTIQRFILVQKNEHPTGDGGYNYQSGDTFEDAVDYAGGEILDGWIPEGVYDLDTGEKIDVSYSSPVIVRSEDQHATVNELDPAAVADQEKFVAENYEHVATSFVVAITCDWQVAAHVEDRLNKYIKCLDGVEHVQIKRDEIRQMRQSEIPS